jgi:hypothetical protein
VVECVGNRLGSARRHKKNPHCLRHEPDGQADPEAGARTMQGNRSQVDDFVRLSLVEPAPTGLSSGMSAFALQLIQFVEDNVNEAITDSSYRRTLLAEADGALSVLIRTVRRSAPEVYPFVSFYLDCDLLKIALDNPQPAAKLSDALHRILKARRTFSA